MAAMAIIIPASRFADEKYILRCVHRDENEI
jgi:hypothetical protein